MGTVPGDKTGVSQTENCFGILPEGDFGQVAPKLLMFWGTVRAGIFGKNEVTSWDNHSFGRQIFTTSAIALNGLIGCV